MKKVNILHTAVDTCSKEELHQQLSLFVTTHAHALVLHVNVHGLNLAYRRSWLRAVFNQAEVVCCDGAGVILGAHILGYHIPQRITYADWMWQLAEFAALNGFTFFFLGGRPNVADQAAARLKERFHEIRVVGTHHGYFDKQHGSAENEMVLRAINAVRPNMLVVGFGMPAQERWLMENWDRIDANVALTSGAAFDYISGNLRRGPSWMTGYGFEWLARLLIEPRRLWRRYVFGNPLFLIRVL